MAGRASEIRDKVNDGVDLWNIRVVLPYVIAYSNAYEGYTKTIQAQAEADKAQAELFVTVASLLTGSILMATVGETSLRAVAGNAALNFVCNHNLERTFNAMAVASDNKTFMFALGKTLDAVKDQANKQIKDIVTKLLARAQVPTSNPTAKRAEMDQVVLQHKQAAIQTAEFLEQHRSVPQGIKNAGLAAIEAAPICTPPQDHINPEPLSKKIELLIYLKMLLGSAELSVYGPNYGNPNPRPLSTKPVTELPSSPSFPQSLVRPDGSGQAVGYSMSGDPFMGVGAIRARIDELNQAIYHQPFFARRGMFSPYMAEQKRGELADAERKINQLAQDTRPMSLLALKS